MTEWNNMAESRDRNFSKRGGERERETEKYSPCPKRRMITCNAYCFNVRKGKVYVTTFM
jgi:hypothetical protein